VRIASLLPSATEIVCALGLRDSLVGISHECDFPSSVLGLPVLTGSILDAGLSPSEIDAAVQRASLERQPIYTVDGALLASLAPDLIVTQGVCAVCAVTEETVETSLAFLPVDAMCSAPVLSLEAKDFAGIQLDIHALASAARVVDRAAPLCADMDARWASPSAPVGSMSAPRVLMLEWADPPWGAGHWVPEQVAAAGAEDVFGAAGSASQRLDWDAIVAADPDYIFSISCGYDLAQNAALARELYAHPVASGLRALRGGNLWALDANSYFSRPAPRVVRGAELLRGVFTGEGDLAGERVRVIGDHGG